MSEYLKSIDLTKVTVTAMICATVLAMALLIWPTPYAYHYYEYPRGVLVTRTTRFTGHSFTTVPGRNSRPGRSGEPAE